MSEEGDNLGADTGAADGGAAAANAAAAAAQDSWLKTMPEDMQSDPSLTKFTDVESLAKSYVNAQRLIGQDKIPMPQTDEDYQNVYRRLGAPETAEGYEFGDVEWPEGFNKPDVDEKMRELVFSNNLNPKQAAAVRDNFYNSLLEMAQGNKTKNDQTYEQGIKTIKEEWGEAANGNLELASRVINDYSDENTQQFLKETGLVKDPRMLRMFGKIGQKLVEDRVMEGVKGAGMSPVDINSQIKSIEANPAYLDKRHPEHKSLVGQVQTLYEKLHPE